MHISKEQSEKELRGYYRTWYKIRRFNRYTKKYVWVLVNKAQGVVVFFYDEGSRGRRVLTYFLEKSDLKVLMSMVTMSNTLLDGELEKTDHLIYMVHEKVQLSKACEHGEDDVAKEFKDMISELYDFEKGTDEKSEQRRYNNSTPWGGDI